MEYGTVLQFLQSKEYVEQGFFLKDIDITMDYAGSFDQEEVAIWLPFMTFGVREQLKTQQKLYRTIATELDRNV